MSWARPSPRLLRGSVVRAKKQVFAVAGRLMAQLFGLIARTAEGQPPVGGFSSQFALAVTVMPMSANAVMKCCAAAQKSALPIWACHGYVVEPVTVPVGHVALKLQL